MSMICVRRLQTDMTLLRRSRSEYSPILRFVVDTENIQTWYFLVIGQPGTPYEGGKYICQILIPSGYPFKPVDYQVLTPNGRFKTHQKICMDNTGFHPDKWVPTWTLPQLAMVFLSVMQDYDSSSQEYGVGHIRCTSESLRKMVPLANEYNQTHYSKLMEVFESADPLAVVDLGTILGDAS